MGEIRNWTMPQRQAPILAEADVVIVGGGYPGVCAAVGAARAGASVALIERDGMLGGQVAEIYTFGLDGFIDRNGKQFVAGVPWEILRRTLAEGQSDPTWDKIDYERLERDGLEAELGRCGLPIESLFVSSNYVNPGAFRYVLHCLAEEAGVTTFLESPLVDVMRDGNRVTGIVAQGEYGPFALAAQVVQSTDPSDMTEQHVPWEHMVEGGNVCEDSIARVMGHPDPKKAPQGWQFPYRALVPRSFDGLLLTGKPACRKLHYHGTNAAVGHAAGVAAAVAAQADVQPRDVCVRKVQEELARQGAVVF